MAVLIILISLFLGTMAATIIISLIPGLAVFILEKFRIYKKGSLTVVTGDYITGAGYHRRGKLYMFRKENGSERFESGRVFGWLLLIFIPFFLLIGIIFISFY
ncbi:MAG: hypothetical protein JW917_02410 [Ignavibacteria bacterium]|nr:hypothetical protein [Ignavibacteria bacterium]